MTDDDDPTPPRDPLPDEPAPAPGNSALRDILWFLDQARLRGYRVGPYVRHGATVLQVQDIRQAAAERYEMSTPDVGIWEIHGHRGE